MSITYGELFTGIGGLSRGLEAAGMAPLWFAENDELCSHVLATHWPHVPNLGDATTIDWAEVPRVDLVAGGFPCQDLSGAGRRAGIEGQRSRLWAEIARAVRHLRPRYVLVENTPGLLARGMGRVLADLAELGYDAEWDCVPAASVGAPHLRARIWILAYPRSQRDQETGGLQAGWSEPQLRSWWLAEPEVRRVADGVPGRLVQPELAALGNAVVPQVAEHVGRLIVEASTREAAA